MERKPVDVVIVVVVIVTAVVDVDCNTEIWHVTMVVVCCDGE